MKKGETEDQEQDVAKILLRSFGFKHGVPENPNFLCDVRFLANPYWVEKLRPKSGLEKEISDYVLAKEESRTLVRQLAGMLAILAKQYGQSKKNIFEINIGCTGGRHRSVAVVEQLAREMRDLFPDLMVEHRDINKE